MRIAITAAVAAALAFFAASMLGVASAEAPTPSTATAPTPVSASPPVRTVSVQGTANVPLAQGANAASATSAYRQGMAAAVSDAQSKAEFLATKVGATLGSAQTVSEDGGDIQCASEESKYAEYEGEQPDFGSGRTVGLPVAAAAAPAAPSPRAVVRRRKARRPSARKASAATCTLSAQVSLVYTID